MSVLLMFVKRVFGETFSLLCPFIRSLLLNVILKTGSYVQVESKKTGFNYFHT